MYEILGMELSGGTLAILIGAYVTASIAAIVLIPWLAIPQRSGILTLDTQAKIVELRSKIRQSVIKVVGGVTAVTAFIVAIQQIRQNEDSFKEKKADLFSKSVSAMFDPTTDVSKRAGAMYLLSYVAGSDPSYYRTVYDTLASHIVALSAKACNDIRTPGYRVDQQIQLALRIIGERNPEKDVSKKRLDVEGACLVQADMRDEVGVVKGLRGLRLSNARMLRSDFTNADLSGAELKYVEAGDYMNKGWSYKMGLSLNRGAEGDDRRRFVTFFVGAKLKKANFHGADLAAADFSGADLTEADFQYANVARARFVGATNLTAAQLKKACVGQPGMKPDEVRAEQPYLSAALRSELGAEGVPKCKRPDE